MWIEILAQWDKGESKVSFWVPGSMDNTLRESGKSKSGKTMLEFMQIWFLVVEKHLNRSTRALLMWFQDSISLTLAYRPHA